MYDQQMILESTRGRLGFPQTNFYILPPQILKVIDLNCLLQITLYLVWDFLFFLVVVVS